MQVDEAFQAYLKDQAFAVLCLEMDLGSGPEAVLLVKTNRDLAEGLRAAEAAVHLGWLVEDTATGPVLCLLFLCGQDGVGELGGESYFDVAAEEDRQLLGRLATQERLAVAYLDEELQVAWFRALPWPELDRLAVEQALDRAEDLLERTESYDPEAAREELQQRLTLDQLVERVFPDGVG
ncbi:MAG: hypothetical protein P1P84_24865 [Deferrisomatales bacterium]|nr:hypothetical protein [Deferrisomatales bacterium]